MSVAGKRKRRHDKDQENWPALASLGDLEEVGDLEFLDISAMEITVSQTASNNPLRLLDSSDNSAQEICQFLDDLRPEKIQKLLSTLRPFDCALHGIAEWGLRALGVTEADRPSLFATPLIRAVLKLKIPIALAIIRRYAAVLELNTCAVLKRDDKNDINIDLLTWAVLLQSAEVAVACIRTCNKYQAMMVSCWLGYVNFVRMIIVAGFDVNQRTWDAISLCYRLPLECALMEPSPGQTDTVRFLVDAGATVRQSSIVTAIDGPNPRLADILLRGLPAEKLEDLLFRYCRLGRPDVVRLLLNASGRPLQFTADKTTEDGESLFMLAAAAGNDDVMSLLLRHLRDTSADLTGSSHASSSQMVTRFLDLQDRHRNTALHHALKAKAFGCAIMLLDAGVDLLKQNDAGVSAIELASESAEGLPFVRAALPLVVGIAEQHKLFCIPKKPTLANNVCSICLDRPASTALVPCGHLGFCLEDANAFVHKSCPICRKPATGTLVTYPCFCN